MRETGSSTPGNGRPGEASITISGPIEEIDAIRQMIAGMIWLAYKNPGDGKGKLEVSDRFKPLPSPIDDPHIPPQWQSEIGLGNIPAEWAPRIRETIPKDYGWALPHYYMSHIFNTKENIPKLQDWGFECMRSRRGADGKFWETWYLPGDWAAKGALREYIETLEHNMHWEQKTKLICHWLAERIRFGTLDVSVQRMALPNPD